jgi:hypothetical protein
MWNASEKVVMKSAISNQRLIIRNHKIREFKTIVHYRSGWVSRKHAAFAPASQKRLDSRLRSPRPSVEEPCPLSLPYGLLDTQPDPFIHSL